MGELNEPPLNLIQPNLWTIKYFNVWLLNFFYNFEEFLKSLKRRKPKKWKGNFRPILNERTKKVFLRFE